MLPLLLPGLTRVNSTMPQLTPDDPQSAPLKSVSQATPPSKGPWMVVAPCGEECP